MNGDIALAGFMMTAEEWQALDPLHRAQLLAAATRRDEPWVVAPVVSALSAPYPLPTDER
jgi:hypothetical protein